MSLRKSMSFVGFLIALGLAYAIFDSFLEPEEIREPASVAANYESLRACEKQEILWKKSRDSVYSELPEFRKFGALQLLAMAKQEVGLKGSLHSDFAPKGWKKYIHGRGVMAKVKIVPKAGAWTGLFQGADCALLRLSLTFRPVGKRDVAPGIALKVLRDGVPSGNISALVSLEGQKKDFNFLKNPLSNIVPIGSGIGPLLVNRIFRRATDYPEELLVHEMAGIDARGAQATSIVSPRHIFFVPVADLGFSSAEHDVREDLLKIPAGTRLYEIRAVSSKYKDFDYAKYTQEQVASFLAESEPVAEIVTESEFIASQFGDDGIFFRHEVRPRK